MNVGLVIKNVKRTYRIYTIINEKRRNGKKRYYNKEVLILISQFYQF